MVVLRFVQEDDDSAAMIVEKLNQANLDDETPTGFHFTNCAFYEAIFVRAVMDLLRRASQKGLQLECLSIEECSGRIGEILHVASTLDMFGEIWLAGGSEITQTLTHYGFASISAAMKTNKRLTKLTLTEMEMPRQRAAALGAGLVTSNSQHFKELYMHDVAFADGAIKELASGLKRNSSLCTFKLHDCWLGDAKLAVLIGALESHPSLKELSLWGNQGQKHALVALGKVLASSKCQLEELDFSHQGANDNGHDGLTGRLGILAQGLRGNESLARLHLSRCKLRDEDIDDLGQLLATCKLQELYLENNSITLSGFVSLTQNIPKSLKQFRFYGNDFDQEEAACHTLTLFEEHPQLWEDGHHWQVSKLPIHQKIQHFKDLNRCGRILLLAHNGRPIPLSVWPLVLARANAWRFVSDKERAPNVIFHLLQGPALMQRRFDRDSSQTACVGAGTSERLTTSSKRGPAETIDKENAKKGKIRI
jgi:hypothetical protein